MTHRAMTRWSVALAICLLSARPTTSLPDGAPPASCQHLVPLHSGGKIASSVAPYQVQPTAGEGRARLLLGSPQGLGYRGFILVARDLESGENVGTFSNVPELAKVIECAPDRGFAVTHSNTEDKRNLEFDWVVPTPDYEGTVVFNATFAQNYSQYWVGVESPPVRLTKRSIDVLAGNAAGTISTDRPSTPPYFVAKPTSDYKEEREGETIYEECGRTKNCFGIPNDCIEKRSCVAIIGVLVKGDRYLFDLQATTGKYVAVGLSDDSKMGEDSVVECVNEGDQVGLYASWNSGKSNTRVQMRKGQIRLEAASLRDDGIGCQFWRDKLTSVESTEYDLVRKPYNLLLAVGSSLKANGVGFHDVVYAATAQPKFLSDVGGFAAASNLLLRLHGALMLTSWIGTASVGILLARYYKQTWLGSRFCGVDHWFVWHRSFMLLTWSMTLASFVLIFVELGEWSTETIHASFGLATTALCFVQPFMAAIRPHPGAPRRRLFNCSHWLVGNVAHICGIISIFFAVRLNKAKLPEWVDWILVAYVVLYIVVHLLLTFVGCASDRKARQSFDSFAMKDVHSRGPIGHTDVRRDAPHSSVRKCIFGVYFVLVLFISLSLVLITVFAPIEETWMSLTNAISSY